MDMKEFEQAIATEFSGMTTEQVLKLAELGKDVLSASDDMIEDALSITEQILKADSDLTRSVQYSLSSMITVAKLIHEYKS